MFEKYLTENVENEILSKVEDELLINLKDYTLGKIKESYRQHFIDELNAVVDKVVATVVNSGFKRVSRDVVVSSVLKELTFHRICETTNEVVKYARSVGDSMIGECVGEVYKDYCQFCKTYNLNARGKITFSKEFQKVTGLKSKSTSVAGKSVRVFVKE